MRSLDISAERLNVILGVLVRAGHVLTAPSDIADSLRRIAELCVQAFADQCSIRVLIEALEPDEFVVSVGNHPERPLGERGRIAERLVAGRLVIGEIVCETASPEGFDEAIREAVKLLALELAAIVSARAAMMREHRVADRFQRALLPEHLPDVAGVRFSAAYRPASEEAEVGGDWYDAFLLSDGRVAISVGDVAGHGIDAAVIMGEVRQAIRMAALADVQAPSDVLEHVNGVLRLRETIGMVTAIFGLYDPRTSVLSYAVAGHPPPILSLRSAPPRRLPTGGLPLGCAARTESLSWTFTVPEGARAVFYTDGLIENERDIVAGEQRLLEAIEGLDSMGVDPASTIEEGVFGGKPNRDDAAIFVLSRSAPVDRYVFSALPIVSPLARAIVAQSIEPFGLDEERRFGMLVAVGEAIANAIEHAYRGAPPGLISMGIEYVDGQLVLTVEDFGRWRPYVPREERGRGIELMHAFMDGVQIRSTRESTSIVLRARVGAS